MVNLFEPRNITIKLQNKLNEALSKNKQIYETKFTIDIINFKGEDI